MNAPFGVEARCEQASVSPGKTRLWASIRLDARGKALEEERSPLAIALVIDVSGSMQGDPIEQVLRSCEIVAELLGPRDQLAIVTFGDHAGVRCGLTAQGEAGRAQIVLALRDVVASGSTNLHAGMEAGAGLLVSSPPGLRRAMVVLSDGHPNVGMSTASELGAYVRSLRPVGVSSLGFGLHHDEDVLVAIATAGSGRYAYVPDPVAARVDLARAALAHGGIVADSLELRLRPAEGVELLRILPAAQLRHGGSGVSAAIGDVFVDESRSLAIELELDIQGSRGKLAEIVVTGRSPDGAHHEVAAELVVDVHAGPHLVVRDAQREVLMVRADARRAEARAQADRGAMPAAASLLREMIQQIEASSGFVRNDGSPLAEMREQLEDEAANYERRGSDAERSHQRKGSLQYNYSHKLQKSKQPAPAALIGISGPVANQRFELFTESSIGRSADNEIPVSHGSLSRRHARILYLDDRFVVNDLGSTNGTTVNGKRVTSRQLDEGDVIAIGDIQLRFERDPTRA